MISVGAAIAVGGIIYYMWYRKSHSTSRENMIAEFYHRSEGHFDALPYMEHIHNITSANTHPHRSLNPRAHYALWIVPGVQPKLHPPVDKFHGYHITLLPMQPVHLPQDYSIERHLLTFPSDVNRRWNLGLPNISIDVKHTQSHLAVMVIKGAGTLNLLRKFMQTPYKVNGETVKWNPLHQRNTADASVNHTIDNFNMLTLGSDDPYEQAKVNAFTYQTTWYLQLVRGPNFEWVPDQRVMLYAAKGMEG